MDQFYYFLRRILFTVIANPLCPFAFSLSFVMLYIVLFYIIQSIYSIQINIKILGDKILHCIFRKELLKLSIQLRCQCFVVGNDQRRFIQLLNDVCHRKCLSGSGNTQKCLTLIALPKTTDQTVDRLRLVSGGLIWGL